MGPAAGVRDPTVDLARRGLVAAVTIADQRAGEAAEFDRQQIAAAAGREAVDYGGRLNPNPLHLTTLVA